MVKVKRRSITVRSSRSSDRWAGSIPDGPISGRAWRSRVGADLRRKYRSNPTYPGRASVTYTLVGKRRSVSCPKCRRYIGA
jgi:hypothetical protein